MALHGLLCLLVGHAALTAAQAQAPVLTTLHSFNSYADGGQSQSDLIKASDGTLYGTTNTGGISNLGTVYKVTDGVVTTLHSFIGNPDGQHPYAARLLLASDGNLYGTTYEGGTSNLGTVYRITITPGSPETYAYKKLFDFTSANGQTPYGALIQGADGKVYGTTVYGGTNNYGAVYRFTLGTAPALSLFYSFTNGSPNADGAHPHAGLIKATDGNFYGTTYDGGGSSNVGTVFQLTPAGVLTTTHIFSNADGANPEYGGLMQASDGKIYGTTLHGGSSGDGTIFQIGTGTAPTFSSLISFNNGTNPGYYPYSRLIQATDGKLYGTTSLGGTNGDGTIYRIATGTGNALLPVYAFQNTTDGNTAYGGLVQAADGSLYGNTYAGGVTAGSGPQRNLGVLYKVTTGGTLTTIFAFNNGFYDGYTPYAKLVQGTDGNFYGTTRTGGYQNSGVIFKMTPTGGYTVLHHFGSGTANDGYYSQSKLVQARDGNFYGTASSGGSFGGGIVFRITPAGTYTVLHNFPGGGNGSTPYAGLVQGVGSDNSLYGTTQRGGTSSVGTVFKITTSGAVTYLHTFTGGTDGAYPYAGVTIGSDGFLYGVTEQGGAIAAGPTNNGTFYKLSTAGDTTSYAATPFTGNGATYPNGGQYPEGDLVEAAPGVFYGTTRYGGAYSDGTVFSATSAGVITTAHSFDSADGYYPYAGLLLASDGALYGSVVNSNAPNTGTLYSLTAGGTFSLLYNFSPNPSSLGNPDGVNPYGALIEGSDGNLYGTASGGGTSNAGTLFKINAYVPNITGFSPSSAGIGATVTISGNHLTGASAVKFGTGTATTFIVNSDTQITALVPSSAVSGSITVTTPHGTTSRAGFTLLSTPAPFINAVSPYSGAPGALVVLIGGNFTGATSVTFNGTAAAFVINSASSITTTVPTGASSGKISVTTPSGTGYTLNPFVVTASNVPTITGFTPATAPVGSLVQISGTGFNSVSDVSFHGTPASFIVDSDTLITAIVPTGATTGTVTVTTFDGTAVSAAVFTVATAALPTITSFTPTQGVAGTTVQITGTNFTGAKTVKFGGVSARFAVVSSTLITAKVPANAVSGTLTVTTAAGTGTSTGSFTASPVITAFTPAHAAVGAAVVITGLNFTNTTSVKFNVTAATFVVNSATQITAKVPTGATTGKISVTTPVSTATSSTSFAVP